MNARTQISIDHEMRRRAQAKAAEPGLSFAEYVRRLIARNIGPAKAKPAVSIIFNLVDEGEPTDIGRDKHKMIGEAVCDDYLRKAAPSAGASREPARP